MRRPKTNEAMEKGRWKEVVLSHTTAYGDADRGATGPGRDQSMWCPQRPVVQTSVTPRIAAFSVCRRGTSITNMGAAASPLNNG